MFFFETRTFLIRKVYINKYYNTCIMYINNTKYEASFHLYCVDYYTYECKEKNINSIIIFKNRYKN